MTGRGLSGLASRSLKVPLPILFFLLMSLVILSVYDILSQSQEVHQLANRRVGKVILDSTLQNVHTNLNGYAARLASQGIGRVNLDEPFLQAAPEASDRLARRVLILYLNATGEVADGFIGNAPLAPAARDALTTQVQAPRRELTDTEGESTGLRLLQAAGADYVISEGRAVAEPGHPGGPVRAMVGLPVEDLLIDELKRYEIFSTGSLSRYLRDSNLGSVGGILRIVTELQNEEYQEFHLDAVAQIFAVLIAFVICIMIGQHIDEKADALKVSLAELTQREKEAQRLRRAAENANRRLNQQNVELATANQAKTVFLANMSHELRTPLNAIIGFSEVMMREQYGPHGDPHYAEYAGDIHASGKHLLDIINDILDLSRISAGKLEISESIFNVAAALTAAARIVGKRAAEKGVELHLEMPAHLPQLYADERALRQVFLNLLDNAVKFTPRGGRIEASARCEADGSFELVVTDTGIGIDAADLPKIVEPFMQVDSSLSRRHQGTGLGLPLVKSLVELHGGSLDIHSEIDVGTVVTVRLPHRQAPGDAPLAQPVSDKPAAPKRDFAAAFSPALGHSGAD